MLKKNNRLTWKDINFLVKHWKFIRWWMFNFSIYKQYQNKKLNQLSVNIPLKLTKRAVIRHKIKRIILRYLKEKEIQETTIKEKYRKIFITLNKWFIKDIQKNIKSDLLKENIIKWFEKSFEICKKSLR